MSDWRPFSGDPGTIQIRNVYIVDEESKIFPWRAKFKLTVVVADSGKSDKKLEHSVNLSNHLPIQGLSVYLERENESPTSPLRIADIVPLITTKVLKDVKVQCLVHTKTGLVEVGKLFRLEVVFPIPIVPIDNKRSLDPGSILDEEFHYEINFKNDRSGDAYNLTRFAEEINSLATSGNSVMITWIQGGIGQGKSTFIQHLSKYWSDPSAASSFKWFQINLTELIDERPVTLKHLLKKVRDKIHSRVTIKKGGEPTYEDKKDWEFEEYILEYYVSIKNQEYQGLLFILDEFDVLWDTTTHKSAPLNVDELLKRLIWIMSIAPSGADKPFMPAVLLISDHFRLEERLQKQKVAEAISNFHQGPVYLELWNQTNAQQTQFHFAVREFKLNRQMDIGQIVSALLELLPPYESSQDVIAAFADRIWVWTRGHPACVNSLIFHYLTYCKDSGKETQGWPLLDQVIEEKHEVIWETIEYVVSKATKETNFPGRDHGDSSRTPNVTRTSPDEQNYLKRLLQGPLQLSDEIIDALYQKGLIDEKNRISNPLLEHFLSKNLAKK